jgi:hypothetical protein
VRPVESNPAASTESASAMASAGRTRFWNHPQSAQATDMATVFRVRNRTDEVVFSDWQLLQGIAVMWGDLSGLGAVPLVVAA